MTRFATLIQAKIKEIPRGENEVVPEVCCIYKFDQRNAHMFFCMEVLSPIVHYGRSKSDAQKRQLCRLDASDGSDDAAAYGRRRRPRSPHPLPRRRHPRPRRIHACHRLRKAAAAAAAAAAITDDTGGWYLHPSGPRARPARMQSRRPQDCLRHGSGALHLSPAEVAAAHHRPC